MLLPTDRRARRWLCAASALLLALTLAGPASASPETLKRSFQNMIFGPLDFVLGPIVGTRAVYNGLQNVDDSTSVRVAYAVPGVAWNSAVCMGGGVLRMISGILELVPGLVLLPFEADMDPLFAPADKSDALVWEDAGDFEIKFGVNYVE
ncbi:MAG: hypothetical protein QNK04_12305 [Myxococcota bacterium]|nr:hypothetical protein [Myxococcota bacterium]